MNDGSFPKMPSESGWLTGQMLVAMPTMQDPRFARTVIFMCAHHPEGAMGLVINRLNHEITFPELMQQLDYTPLSGAPEVPVHFGGPVETNRGFVLHSTDYMHDATMKISDNIALTGTVEILKAIAEGNGPERSLLTLGYAGWSAGQLDAELQTTGWLIAPADESYIFDPDLETKWERAYAKIGVSPSLLSGYVGHA